MAANTSPIFSKKGRASWAQGVVTANTTKDLTAGTIYEVFAADATEGSYVEKLVAQALGTNVATVLRIWLNNGSSTGTAANNSLIKDVTLPATTNSEVAAIGNAEIPINLALPAGYKIYVTIGTGVAAGFDVTAVGGDY
jgi:hypothetical protein